MKFSTNNRIYFKCVVTRQRSILTFGLAVFIDGKAKYLVKIFSE